MPRLLIILCVLVLAPMMLWAEDQDSVYTDKQFGITMNVPAHWTTTTVEQLINKLKADPKVTPDVLTAIKGVGLIVDVSQRPLEGKMEINPNVTVAVKDITVDPKPTDEQSMIQFAGNILAQTVPDPLSLPSPTKVTIAGLLGLSSEFATSIPEKGLLKSRVYVLVDVLQNKYYILTATFSDDKVVADQVIGVANSFSLIKS